MGKPLDRDVLEAFFDETVSITKQAAPPLRPISKLVQKGIASSKPSPPMRETLHEILSRVTSPLSGLSKGWQAMSPRTHRETLEGIAKEVAKAQSSGVKAPWYKLPFLRAQSATHIVPEAALQIGPMPQGVQRGLSSYRMAHPEGVSLVDIVRGTAEGVPQNRARALAEELSRRGWTGKTQATKYLPIGEKGVLAGFTGAAVPSIVHAPEATPTGEEGRMSRLLGEAGGAGGWVLGSGLGLPGMALWYGAQKGGTAVGRILDRMRAGANFRQAVEAPSPEEARQQLETMSRYYG